MGRHLGAELSGELGGLALQITELATDLRWTWSHAADALWQMIDPQTWDSTGNPHEVLQNLTETRVRELSADHQFRDDLERLASERRAYNDQPAWFGETHMGGVLRGVAYFSMEFGLGEALPLYAGGLGVLAGDFLKSASDLGVPLIGVGLLYQEGYFRQVVDSNGWQHEVYPYNDSASLPIQPVATAEGAWLHVAIEFPGRQVQLRVWQAQVGRLTLYLLDSNDPSNNPADRGITGKLYGGGHEERLVQEIVLGVGGWRVIEALGLEIDVCHLNEGHAAFVTLERACGWMRRTGVDFWEALWATRAGNVFTTHTPVRAGFDTYERALVAKYGRQYAADAGVRPAELAALGMADPTDEDEPFNMAYLAARTCAHINGVSRLHGAVSRGIFQPLYHRWPTDEVPIAHVTNGVHVPSWDSAWADDLWTQCCGKERWRGATEEALQAAVHGADDETVWRMRGSQRAALVDQARSRLARHLAQRGCDPATVATARFVLDPNVLTLGFARRFTDYKRPNLLLRDPERFARLLTDPRRPVQILVAGKAHPADEEGKQFIQEWMRFVQRPEIRAHAVFLEDYDIGLAQELVQGVDVWVNTPRRPWEASGTSGMKVLVNGGLNLSELDGWWAEAYRPEVGWAVGDVAEPHTDAEEALRLYELLEQEIVPSFYDRDATGVPRGWVGRIRASMAELAPRFSASRMVREYVESVYLAAAEELVRRTGEGGRHARELRDWARRLDQAWSLAHFGKIDVAREDAQWVFQVQVYLGGITATDIAVELYAERSDTASAVCQGMELVGEIPGAVRAYIFRGSVPGDRPASDFTPRIVPHQEGVGVPGEMSLVLWAR